MLLRTVKKAIKFNLESINNAIDSEVKRLRKLSNNKFYIEFDKSNNNIDRLRASIKDKIDY